MNKELAARECKPCADDAQPLKGDALTAISSQLPGDWNIRNEHHLEKTYKFKNFREALDFTNRVGEIAEQQGHHPDIFLSWGEVRLTIWTHKIDGLTESDFILAAKADSVR